jgi:hypothetical protein
MFGHETIFDKTELYTISLAWWYMHIISALGRLRQKDFKFKATMGYILIPYIRNNNNKKTIQSLCACVY